MIITSWNVRGLGRPEKRRMVKTLVKKEKIDLLFLQETKVSKDINRIIMEIWGSRNFAWEWVPSDGAAAGLITVWKEEVFIKIDVSKMPRALFIKLTSVADGFTWNASNAYF